MEAELAAVEAALAARWPQMRVRCDNLGHLAEGAYEWTGHNQNVLVILEPDHWTLDLREGFEVPCDTCHGLGYVPNVTTDALLDTVFGNGWAIQADPTIVHLLKRLSNSPFSEAIGSASMAGITHREALARALAAAQGMAVEVRGLEGA